MEPIILLVRHICNKQHMLIRLRPEQTIRSQYELTCESNKSSSHRTTQLCAYLIITRDISVSGHVQLQLPLHKLPELSSCSKGFVKPQAKHSYYWSLLSLQRHLVTKTVCSEIRDLCFYPAVAWDELSEVSESALRFQHEHTHL